MCSSVEKQHDALTTFVEHRYLQYNANCVTGQDFVGQQKLVSTGGHDHGKYIADTGIL